MTTDERIDRLTAVISAHDGQIDALASTVNRMVGAVNAIAEAVATQNLRIEAHDRQIDDLLAISEKNARNWESLERQFVAYLKTLPRN